MGIILYSLINNTHTAVFNGLKPFRIGRSFEFVRNIQETHFVLKLILQIILVFMQQYV